MNARALTSSSRSPRSFGSAYQCRQIRASAWHPPLFPLFTFVVIWHLFSHLSYKVAIDPPSIPELRERARLLDVRRCLSRPPSSGASARHISVVRSWTRRICIHVRLLDLCHRFPICLCHDLSLVIYRTRLSLIPRPQNVRASTWRPSFSPPLRSFSSICQLRSSRPSIPEPGNLRVSTWYLPLLPLPPPFRNLARHFCRQRSLPVGCLPSWIARHRVGQVELTHGARGVDV